MLIDPEIIGWTNWMETWSGLAIYPQCRGFFKGIECPHCNYRYEHLVIKQKVKGKEVDVPTLTQMGAIDYTTYSFISLMEREWKRHTRRPSLATYHCHQVPERLLIVILVWNLFESLMDKFFTDGMHHVSERIAKDLLKRYNSIGSRMDQLYKLLFGVSLEDDLCQVNYGHIYGHLKRVQEKRNQFIHGDPYDIDEALIKETVENLQETQKAWIALYNLRCRKINK